MKMQLPCSDSLPICRLHGSCWATQRRVFLFTSRLQSKNWVTEVCFRSSFLELNIAKTKQLVLWAPRPISIDSQEVEIVKSCMHSCSQASKQRKQEEHTLRRLKFICRFTKLVLLKSRKCTPVTQSILCLIFLMCVATMHHYTTMDKNLITMCSL